MKKHKEYEQYFTHLIREHKGMWTLLHTTSPVWWQNTRNIIIWTILHRSYKRTQVNVYSTSQVWWQNTQECANIQKMKISQVLTCILMSSYGSSAVCVTVSSSCMKNKQFYSTHLHLLENLYHLKQTKLNNYFLHWIIEPNSMSSLELTNCATWLHHQMCYPITV